MFREQRQNWERKEKPPPGTKMDRGRGDKLGGGEYKKLRTSDRLNSHRPTGLGVITKGLKNSTGHLTGREKGGGRKADPKVHGELPSVSVSLINETWNQPSLTRTWSKEEEENRGDSETKTQKPSKSSGGQPSNKKKNRLSLMSCLRGGWLGLSERNHLEITPNLHWTGIL